MAQLTFGMPKGEVTLKVLVGHDFRHQRTLLAAGQPLPRPVWTLGVIDTGSNVTCVTAAVLQKLGLVFTGQVASHTAAGQVIVNLFEVSLSIPPPGNLPGAMLSRPNLLVM